MKPCLGKPSTLLCSHRSRWSTRTVNLYFNSVNGVHFLCCELYCALLVSSPLMKQRAGFRLVYRMDKKHISQETKSFLCKVWILAYSYITHSTSNYTFTRDIYRTEHTSAIYSVLSSNLSCGGKATV